jgi:hypothetical protein
LGLVTILWGAIFIAGGCADPVEQLAREKQQAAPWGKTEGARRKG